MLGRLIGKLTFGNINYKYRTSSEQNTRLYDVLTLWGGCGPQGGCGVHDSIFHAERFSLLLAKSYDLIAALIPCKQKRPLMLSALRQMRTAVL